MTSKTTRDLIIESQYLVAWNRSNGIMKPRRWDGYTLKTKNCICSVSAKKIVARTNKVRSHAMCCDVIIIINVLIGTQHQSPTGITFDNKTCQSPTPCIRTPAPCTSTSPLCTSTSPPCACTSPLCARRHRARAQQHHAPHTHTSKPLGDTLSLMHNKPRVLM